MKPIFALLFATFVCTSSASGQRSVEIRLSDDQQNFPRLLSSVFDTSTKYLFSVLGNKVRVHRTDDGSLMRELALPAPPGLAGNVARDWSDSSSFYQQGHIALALDGKSLVVITESEQIFLIRVEPLVGGGPIELFRILHRDSEPKPMRFVCSIGEDRLLFVTRTIEHNHRLVVYDLATKTFDSASDIELGSRICTTPEYLSYEGSTCVVAHVIGESSDGDGVTAIRVTPLDMQTHITSRVRAKVEKLHFAWDDRGYGRMEVVDGGIVPTIPTAISPSLTHFLAFSNGPLIKKHFSKTVYLASWEQPNQLMTVCKGSGEHNRPVGNRTGLWSADATRFFVNDGNHSSRRRPTSISVHDATGQQIGVLPTGEALCAEVLAVSHTGDLVVTRADLSNRPRAKSRVPASSIEFRIWNLEN